MFNSLIHSVIAILVISINIRGWA